MKTRRFWSILTLCLLLSVTSAFAAGTDAPSQPAGNDIRVLIPNTEHYVLDVWKEGADFLVLVEELWQQTEDGELVNPVSDATGRLITDVELPPDWSGDLGLRVWRKFLDGVVGEYLDIDSDAFPYFPSPWHLYDPEWIVNDEDGWSSMLNSYPWQAMWKDYLVRWGSLDGTQETTGLWLVGEDREPVFVHGGTYANPIVIPGSDEVIASKFRQGEGIMYTMVVSVDLNTFEETTLLYAFPASLVAYAYFDGELLVKATSGEGPDNVAYMLANLDSQQFVQIDASFGEALAQTGPRPLQSAGKPGEYYIVVGNYLDTASGDHCAIGRYNVHDLSFEHLLTLTGVVLDINATWVDAENTVIYSCYDGELVEFLYTDQ